MGIFFLFGCGKERRVTGFETYVADFETAAESIGASTTVSSLVIDWDETGTVDVAQCETGNMFSTPHIRVNQKYWNGIGETARQIMLFHEMGHCVLDRLHRTDRLRDGDPASIMFPILLNSFTYEQSREYYLKELFSAR